MSFSDWLRKNEQLEGTPPRLPVVTPAPPPFVVAPVPVFDRAFEYTMVNEGGYSDVPQDHGKKTNWGIIESEYSRWLGRAATEADMKDLTKETAKQIYESWYWRPLHLDSVVGEHVAMALFDRAVLGGLTGCSDLVRLALGKPAVGRANFDDCIREINQTNPVSFVMRLSDLCEAQHRARVAAHPDQGIFLKGWIRRCERMKRELGDGTVSANG